MAKRDIEPKTVWTCDRCAAEIEMRRTDVMPMYWRRWCKASEHNVEMEEKHLCSPCSNLLDEVLRA